MPQAVTANRLSDGRVVFRTADGGWTLSVADAALAGTQDEAAALIASAEADRLKQIVVDVYPIDMDVSGSAPKPSRLREAIRAAGPTMAYGEAALREQMAHQAPTTSEEAAR